MDSTNGSGLSGGVYCVLLRRGSDCWEKQLGIDTLRNPWAISDSLLKICKPYNPTVFL